MNRRLLLPLLTLLAACSAPQEDRKPIASAGAVNPATQIQSMEERGLPTTQGSVSTTEPLAGGEPEQIEVIVKKGDKASKRAFIDIMNDPGCQLVRREKLEDGSVRYLFFHHKGSPLLRKKQPSE